MKTSEIFQRLWRKVSLNLVFCRQLPRKTLWRMLGASIGSGTVLPRSRAPWPHQVKIGRDCTIQSDVFFNYDHYWTPGPSILIGDRVFLGRGVEINVQGPFQIGDDSLIASHCYFIDHDHGTRTDRNINDQPNTIRPITLGKNVWLGAGCIILKGVSIGDGAIIGAGSVVTKSVPAHEIWVGNPARCLRRRTAEDHPPVTPA